MKWIGQFFIIAIGIFSFSPSVTAEAVGTKISSNIPIVKVNKRDFKEYDDYRKKISQSAFDPLVGIMMGSLDGPNVIPTITIQGIKETDKRICVGIEHISGRYYSKFSIKNPQKGSIIQLQLPSKRIKKLASAPNQLTIKAKASQSKKCDDSSEFLGANWGGNASSNQAHFFLNVSVGSRARVKLSNFKTPFKCISADRYVDFGGTNMETFTQICTIPLTGDCNEEMGYKILLNEGDKRVPTKAGNLRTVCDF